MNPLTKLVEWFKVHFVYDEMADVRRFYTKFSQPIGKRPTLSNVSQSRLRERAAFMQEELDEFVLAKNNGSLPDMADALIDLVYVAKGTAIELGLPWEDLWVDVQRANMAKVRGTTHRGIAIDVTKPPGWIGPRTEEILADALEKSWAQFKK